MFKKSLRISLIYQSSLMKCVREYLSIHLHFRERIFIYLIAFTLTEVKHSKSPCLYAHTCLSKTLHVKEPGDQSPMKCPMVPLCA